MDKKDLYKTLVRIKKNAEKMEDMQYFKSSLKPKSTAILCDVNRLIRELNSEINNE